MNPIVAALISSPAVADASRRAVTELIPIVERTIRRTRVGKLAALAGPTLLTSCFAAGIAVGWMTAPAKGSETRRKAKDAVQRWAKGARARAQESKQFLTKQLSRRAAHPTSEEAAPPPETNGSSTQPASSSEAHH